MESQYQIDLNSASDAFYSFSARNARNFSFDPIPLRSQPRNVSGGSSSLCTSYSSIYWKRTGFLSETFLRDARNNRDNRVSPLATDHPQRASPNVTRAKSGTALFLSPSCISRRSHLDYSPGVHGTRYAYPHVCSNNWPGCALRARLVPREQSSCNERERERERVA